MMSLLAVFGKSNTIDMKHLIWISTIYFLSVNNLAYSNDIEQVSPNYNHRNAEVFLNQENLIANQEDVDSGLLIKVLEFSSDTYYLWDSEASLIPGNNGETRHVRIRIEERQLNQVQNKLKTIHANGNSLTPKAEINRGHVEIPLDEKKFVRLYPYAENVESLIAAFEEMFYGHTVGITKQGVVYIIGADTIIYGYLDYYIIKPRDFVFQKFSFSEVYKENGFDTILISYPSGVKQKMYFFKAGISTI